MSLRTLLENVTDRRVRLTGYGSPLLARASAVGPAVDAVAGTGVVAFLRRLRAGLVWMILYELLVPGMAVPLSSESSGDVLRQQLSITAHGRFTRRYAQGVLALPATHREYLRGRRRQALRTNLRRAREAGFFVTHHRVEGWSVDPDDPRSAFISAVADVEGFAVFDADGECCAHGFLTIDVRTALLHQATSTASYARWLLHDAVVERLCGSCELLITNTDDVPLMPAGAQHYQRLLGYSIRRLRLDSPLAEWLACPLVRVAGLCLGGAALILANRLAVGFTGTFDERALVWVAVLVAVRRASYRAGPATVTAFLAALMVCAVEGFSHPWAALGWVLAGAALDILAATIQRLTWGSAWMSPAGLVMGLIALLGADMSRIVGSANSGTGPLTSWLAAATLGALAAALGWWLGRWGIRPVTGRIEPRSVSKPRFPRILRFLRFRDRAAGNPL